MRSLFKTYGTMLFIDFTYKLNHNNYPFIVFIVTDNNRNSRIVGFALVAYERISVMQIILNYFKTLNESQDLQVVMIDKDLKEETVIQETYPNVHILYCFWHVQNTFKKKFKNSFNSKNDAC